MDGWVDGWMGGLMDGWRNGLMELMDIVWIDGLVLYGWMYDLMQSYLDYQLQTYLHE